MGRPEDARLDIPSVAKTTAALYPSRESEVGKTACWVLGSRFRVWGLGIWGLGFRVWGLGFRVWDLGFRVWGLGFRVWGLGFRVWAKFSTFNLTISKQPPSIYPKPEETVEIDSSEENDNKWDDLRTQVDEFMSKMKLYGEELVKANKETLRAWFLDLVY
ncbi:hypothetical protein MTR_4g025870 [Medicago truncatula]|uniref:Uncharacterized protein n=1 Tax=Medicago truncatula TaxID=3880 RepID=A0A072UI44_MEDTR|nr:hypothetical protein MTR_4g025870 [Medicago truncatula]